MLMVKKFGGTSVADKDRILKVANRCIEDYKRRKQNSSSSFCNGKTYR